MMCRTPPLSPTHGAVEGLIIAFRAFPDASWHYMEISDEMKEKQQAAVNSSC